MLTHLLLHLRLREARLRLLHRPAPPTVWTRACGGADRSLGLATTCGVAQQTA